MNRARSAPPERDRRVARRSRSRPGASGRQTSGTGSPRLGHPSPAGPGLPAAGAGPAAAATGALYPPVRFRQVYEAGARPNRRRGDRSRSRSRRSGPKRWAARPSGETAPRAIGARGRRRYRPRRRASCRRTCALLHLSCCRTSKTSRWPRLNAERHLSDGHQNTLLAGEIHRTTPSMGGGARYLTESPRHNHPAQCGIQPPSSSPATPTSLSFSLRHRKYRTRPSAAGGRLRVHQPDPYGRPALGGLVGCVRADGASRRPVARPPGGAWPHARWPSRSTGC